jgi:integrase/recombinase XerD
MRKTELASLRFSDVDFTNAELRVRGTVAKNRRDRVIPLDRGLLEIFRKQEAGRATRQPGTGKTAELTEQTQARFSRDHVFVTTGCTPLTHRSSLYSRFMQFCGKAGIQTHTYDGEGRLIEHIDLHSCRRTFATALITGGADPKSVQELLGHRTLDMTMRIYAKVNAGTKRQALGKLSYGMGSVAPDHVIEYSGTAKPNCHKFVASPKVGVVG